MNTLYTQFMYILFNMACYILKKIYIRSFGNTAGPNILNINTISF